MTTDTVGICRTPGCTRPGTIYKGHRAPCEPHLAGLLELMDLHLCEYGDCAEKATHRSGWGNDNTGDFCVDHTRERENAGAWSRSL